MTNEQLAELYNAHEKEQVLRIARTTTPQQRLEWLAKAINFARSLGIAGRNRPVGKQVGE